MSETMSYDEAVVAYGLLLNTLAEAQEKLSARRAGHEHQSGLERDLFVNLIDATTTQLSISQAEATARLRTAFDNAHGIQRLKASMDPSFSPGSTNRGFEYVTDHEADVNDFRHTDTPVWDEAA